MSSIEENMQSLEGQREGIENQFYQFLEQRDEESEQILHSKGPESIEWKETKKNLEFNRTELKKIESIVHRPLNRLELGGLVFLTVTLLFAAFETPVNKFLFDLVLQSSNVISYIISFFVACIILVLAHFSGKTSRQVWSDYKQNINWSFVILTIVIFLVFVLFLSIMSILRAELASSVISTNSDFFSSVTEKITQKGFLNTVFSSLSDKHALGLLTVNILAFMGTYLLGMFTHDYDRHFDHAANAFQKSQEKISTLDKRFKKSINRVVKKYRPRLLRLATLHANINSAVISAKKANGMALEDSDKVDLSKRAKFSYETFLQQNPSDE